MILATCKYSLKVYFEPPINIDPIITGTILPDLAKVTTGNEICDASANDVNVLANTCDVPGLIKKKMSYVYKYIYEF